ncbi:MAG: farnesyl diphosphate synthase [Opitutales bacterium]
MNTQEFKAKYDTLRLQVEDGIEKYLPAADTRPAIIHEAMRYSMKAGGKRIRPILILAAQEMLGGNVDAMPACVAIESLHTYSLIHDDLPCMDNSDLRRGRPTCHKQYDETLALLAGDALLTYSLWFLAESYKDSPEIATGLVRDLGRAGSSEKMIGGQVEDVLNEKNGEDMTADTLVYIHNNKTAALITSAVTMGVRLSENCTEEKLEIAREIGKNIGLAFQVIDDILDTTSDTATLGKTANLDEINNKMTYVTLYGIEGAKNIANELSQKAIDKCDELSDTAEFMKALIQYMQNRIN